MPSSSCSHPHCPIYTLPFRPYPAAHSYSYVPMPLSSPCLSTLLPLQPRFCFLHRFSPSSFSVLSILLLSSPYSFYSSPFLSLSLLITTHCTRHAPRQESQGGHKALREAHQIARQAQAQVVAQARLRSLRSKLDGIQPPSPRRGGRKGMDCPKESVLTLPRPRTPTGSSWVPL